ncbi:MAG: glucosaminidase domain-containing protein [Saprospiraceae bacterium]
MKQSAKRPIILVYLKQHWFKVALMSVVLYLFVQKDFQFSINLNSPVESEPIEMSPENQQLQVAPKKEIFTERKKKSTKNLDKFEMPYPFGGSSKTSPMDNLAKIDDKVKHDYLKRFARVVINERRKYGIPSSIILACGLLQSQGGQRDMAKQGNNHFSLTCSLGWEGDSGVYQNTCYQHYENAWTSFRDHSTYLTSGKFGQLTTLESTDYRGWAKGLENLGYGNKMDDLASHLISIIETYGLDELDRR